MAIWEARDSIEPDQLPQLVGLFAHEWWSQTRTMDDVARMLLASDVVVTLAHRSTGRLVGFARVLTDGVYLALILDVIVEPTARGLGLSSLLMETVLNHPKVSLARSVELVCQPELIPFYQRFGFSDQVGRSQLMRRTTDTALTDVNGVSNLSDLK